MITKTTFLATTYAIMLCSAFGFSQTSSLSIDTLSVHHLLELKATIASDFSEVDSMKVILSGIGEDDDTTGLYLGEFKWEDPDPSDFYVFEMNETQTGLTLGLGYFDPKNYIISVFLYRDGVEELIEN